MLFRITSLLCLAVLLLGGRAAWAQEAPEASKPGARLAFPNHGEVSAFVIFVQHADVPDGAGGFADDPVTEWPHERSLGPDRRLPAWAEDGRLLAAPGTDPNAFAEGSLSAFYDLMSNGRFRLTGYVYPKVYIPEQPLDWYHANRGAFPNGANRRAYEILTSDEIQSYFSENPDGLDLAALDTYQNGTNTFVPGGDGVFDLIILVDRDITLPRLRRNYDNVPISGSSITSFGADAVYRPDHPEDYNDPEQDAFGPTPVTLGGLRVIDNLTSGSGITVHAFTHKQAIRIIAHEIGHRQFGFYHTCDAPFSPDSDCLSIMGGAYLTMSAGDRIKLGWAEVVPIDMPSLGKISTTIPDALASGQVYRVRSGNDQCGDLIVEARFWTNFWDSPPNPDDPAAPFYQNDDGDANDPFLPQEGLYLYKAPEYGNRWCGGSLNLSRDEHRFSSLENSGISRRIYAFQSGLANELGAFLPGGSYKVAYMPGDTYAPYNRPDFFYHEHPSLDAKLSLTNIERHGNTFSVELWTDYYAGPPEAQKTQVEAYPNPFSFYTTIRYEVVEEAHVTVDIYDTQGRRLIRLADGLHQPGLHEVFLVDERLPSGRYWCRVLAGDRSHTIPLDLLR